jgi:nitrite reductase (NO-forming)
MHKRVKLLAILAALMVAALVVTGCGAMGEPPGVPAARAAEEARAAWAAERGPAAQSSGISTSQQPDGAPATAADTQEAGSDGHDMIQQPAPDASAVEIAHDPADVPEPVGQRAPQQVTLELETVELVGQMADGVTYTYWTFNGTVPGPFLRVRVGDTVDVRLTNSADSMMAHSVDFHAVTGPGGGAVHTQVGPGESKSFTFKALNPGLYVYHCATPLIPQHVASGMYGLILVEPEGGLPVVDREFYVMQGDFYTTAQANAQGQHDFSLEKMTAEEPDYVVFNGRVGALSEDKALKAEVGDTLRIYFGVGGPNLTSSFHVIGEIFDRVYPEGAVGSEPSVNVQTTLVPAGGATMVEFKVDVPGRYILVDHSLARLTKGAAGYLEVEGPEAADIFRAGQ